MRKAFSIIELLISMVILFGTIVFMNMTIKTYNDYERKSQIYQNIYVSTLSMKDWLSVQDFTKQNYEKTINDVKFKAYIQPIKEQKNHIFHAELGHGNFGDFLVTLYQIKLVLQYRNREETFSYFITKERRIVPLVKDIL
jgi:type II secretory pathway pseudopilin PulG